MQFESICGLLLFLRQHSEKLRSERLRSFVSLTPRAERKAEKSRSTYHLERSERLRGLGEPITSSGARGLEIFINLTCRPEREAKEFCEPNTASAARG